MEFIKDLNIHYRIDKITEKGPVGSFKELDSIFNSEEIELTEEFVKMIKDAISC